MLDIKQVRERLEGKNLAKVARECGVTYSYIHAISRGIKCDPSYSMLEKLSRVLDE